MLNLALLGAKISQKEQLLRQASLWLAPVRTGSLVSLASRTMPITFSRSTTTTFLDKDGLLKTAGINVPVIEYDANGNCLGLRIWGPVTNLLLRSEDFTAAPWTAFRSTPSANTTTSPNGQVTADKLTEDTSASNTHGIFQTATIANSTVYTFSAFVKPDGRTRVILGLDIGAGEKKTWFDLSSGTVGTNANSAAPIIAYPNGWFRIGVTSTSASTTATVVIKLATADGVEVYSGNGVSSISLFGAQLNPGSLAPYIPTTTLAASSTADVMTITGADAARIINVAEGTLYADFATGSVVPVNVYPTVIALQGQDRQNESVVFTTNNSINFEIRANNINQGDDYTFAQTERGVKVAAIYESRSGTLAANGLLLAPFNVNTLPITSQIFIGNNNGNQNFLDGYIREAAIFRKVLPSRSLVLLTQ